jgi:hypothetical protein
LAHGTLNQLILAKFENDFELKNGSADCGPTFLVQLKMNFFEDTKTNVASPSFDDN